MFLGCLLRDGETGETRSTDEVSIFESRFVSRFGAVFGLVRSGWSLNRLKGLLMLTCRISLQVDVELGKMAGITDV